MTELKIAIQVHRIAFSARFWLKIAISGFSHGLCWKLGKKKFLKLLAEKSAKIGPFSKSQSVLESSKSRLFEFDIKKVEFAIFI